MNLLVVCTANIARSPLAEAMLAWQLGPHGVRLASAGIRAQPGYPAAEESRWLASSRGLDLDYHRSRPVDDRLLAGAHLVLTMSRRQRDLCAPRWPGGAARTFTLAELLRLLETVDDQDGPMAPVERLAWMVGQAHRARPRARPGGEGDDIADPIGLEWSHWETMGARLDELTAGLVDRALLGAPRL
jgi:protein-tyrosine phosphatase